jgi:8-amino-7-oxononanoate synthase
MAMSAALENAGYLITAIRPPTVPEGKARLRITLSALHMPAEVDALVEILARSRDAVQRVRGAA